METRLFEGGGLMLGSSKTSLKGWKQNHSGINNLKRVTSKTSLKGWKLSMRANQLDRLLSLKNFLKGMETCTSRK